MKKTTILIFILFPLWAYSQETIKIDKVPKNIDEFVILRDNLAKTPEGGAAIFALALKIFVSNAELGEKCLIVSADRKSLKENMKGYKGFSLLDHELSLIKSQLGKNTLIPNSYIKGSSPQNKYEVKLPFEYIMTSNSYSGDKSKGTFKVFIACSGADSPRPITMIRNNRGIWKATSWSSLVLGIKPIPVDDDL